MVNEKNNSDIGGVQKRAKKIGAALGNKESKEKEIEKKESGKKG